MCSTESKAEVMKPLLIKAGIPVVLSIAAYVCAKIMSSRCSDSEQTQPANDMESFHSLNSTCPDSPLFDDQGTTTGMDLGNEHDGNLEYKLSELESKLEDLQRKRWELEDRFSRYQNMKEKESTLLEIRNVMVLEKTRAEFLLKEIALLEDENQKVGELILELIKLMQRLEDMKVENGLLKGKARKQWRRAKQRLRVIRKQRLKIEGRDSELLKTGGEIEKQANTIQELENEVCQLKESVDNLQREKIEVANQLDELVEKPDSSNPQIAPSSEDYQNLLSELEQLRKDRNIEENELTFLRWSNTCLKRELVKYHEQQDHNKGEYANPIMDLQLQGNMEKIHDDDNHDGHHVHSKRRKFMQKFKRWVEGDKMGDKENNEIKCFGRHSTCEEEYDHLVEGRKSCSSV